MLLPSFFIIDFEKYEDVPEVNMPMNTHLCYKITSASIHFIESFYAKLFLSPKGYPFCLLLDIGELLNKPEEKDENIIELLVSFTFHARYIKNDRDNPIVLFFINKPNLLPAIKFQIQ